MEQQIRRLEAELHNKPDDFQLSVARKQAPTYKSYIKRSSYSEFLMTTQANEITQEQASLEVLVVENGISATHEPDQHTASHSTSIDQWTSQQTPERLRIRYAPLVKTLERVCKEVLSNYYVWPDLDSYMKKTRGAPTILLRPWKLLVAYEKEIRDCIHHIDSLWEPARREDMSGGVAEIRVVEECEYNPSRFVISNLQAPCSLKWFSPLHVLTVIFGISRVQARRSGTGTENACELS